MSDQLTPLLKALHFWIKAQIWAWPTHSLPPWSPPTTLHLLLSTPVTWPPLYSKPPPGTCRSQGLCICSCLSLPLPQVLMQFGSVPSFRSLFRGNFLQDLLDHTTWKLTPPLPPQIIAPFLAYFSPHFWTLSLCNICFTYLIYYWISLNQNIRIMRPGIFFFFRMFCSLLCHLRWSLAHGRHSADNCSMNECKSEMVIFQ